jgi:hypothetical protein
MAIFKLNSSISSIHGRFGGVYFKKDPSGQHIQAMPSCIRKISMREPSTRMISGIGSRSDNITMFSSMAALWSVLLIALFGAAWAAWAAYNKYVTKNGEYKKITAYDWYMHYSMLDPQHDGTGFAGPPWKPPTTPYKVPLFYVTYKGRWMYEHIPTEWPDECPASYYHKFLPYNGKNAFQDENGKWFVWWRGDTWVISPEMAWEPEGLTFYKTLHPEVKSGNYQNPITKSWCFLNMWERGVEVD